MAPTRRSGMRYPRTALSELFRLLRLEPNNATLWTQLGEWIGDREPRLVRYCSLRAALGPLLAIGRVEGLATKAVDRQERRRRKNALEDVQRQFGPDIVCDIESGRAELPRDRPTRWFLWETTSRLHTRLQLLYSHGAEQKDFRRLILALANILAADEDVRESQAGERAVTALRSWCQNGIKFDRGKLVADLEAEVEAAQRDTPLGAYPWGVEHCLSLLHEVETGQYQNLIDLLAENAAVADPRFACCLPGNPWVPPFGLG